MHIFLALYDPSQPSADGSFWSWRAPTLDRKILDRLYYDVAALNRPADPNQLSTLALVGGFAKISPDWVFAYRFGNGGRDAHGRPGRFVLVVAGIRLDDVSSGAPAALITCEPLIDVIMTAPYSCPVPAPANLEIDIAVQPARVDPVLIAKALRDERLELSGPDAVTMAAALCGSLPQDRQWKCTLSRDTQGSVAVVECPRAPEIPVPALPKPATAQRMPSVPPSSEPWPRARDADYSACRRLFRDAESAGTPFRIIILVWAIVSFLLAVCVAVQMFVTFAPIHLDPHHIAMSEVAGVERAHSIFMLLDLAASFMLAVNALLVVWLVWRRR